MADPKAQAETQLRNVGKKAALLPIYERVKALAERLGPDVETVVQKTGVSFRRRKQFALVQAPSSKRIQLGLNLAETPNDPRIRETKGMCSHRVEIFELDELDDIITGWIERSYDQAG